MKSPCMLCNRESSKMASAVLKLCGFSCACIHTWTLILLKCLQTENKTKTLFTANFKQLALFFHLGILTLFNMSLSLTSSSIAFLSISACFFAASNSKAQEKIRNQSSTHKTWLYQNINSPILTCTATGRPSCLCYIQHKVQVLSG